MVENKYVGIDIGNLETGLVEQFLDENNGLLIAYCLTHAHADHTYGIKKMYETYKMPIYCSENCANEINNSKRNFSLYTDEIDTFEYDLPYTHVGNESKIEIDKIEMQVCLVPGHSPGCVVFSLGNAIFTGDFLMAEYPTPLNFPNSSKADFNNSLRSFARFLENKEGVVIYPGHGKSFVHDGKMEWLNNKFFSK